MLPQKPPVLGAVTVYTRSDVCPYLEYYVDLVEAKYNIYHCTLEETKEPCKYMGWCPIAAQDKFQDERIYTLQDNTCKVRFR
jgi:hypothetical protein